jgi:BirA family biotin operon repressor/biotin-[acetyl-CoA-carboxylase] ligase
MKIPDQILLSLLADGQFHSGPELGRETGRTRTAVWKTIKSLQQSGLTIYSVRGKGYRLAEPIELLNQEAIHAAFDKIAMSHFSQPGDPHTANFLRRLEVFTDIQSTNAYLLEAAKRGESSGFACLAEQQQAGRGRRGRQWVSPFGGNLYLSLLWQFNAGASQLGGLSLAIAVAVMRALRETGLTTSGVKWPNDILVGGRKLAGILLELAGEAAGPCAVVVGVGLNVRAAESEMAAVAQPWTDLESELGKTVARNMLAAQLLYQLIIAVREFESQGLRPFLKEWATHDVFMDCEVSLDLPQGQIQGIARGVDESGALLLAVAGEERGTVQRFHSGEVSMRAAASRRRDTR